MVEAVGLPEELLDLLTQRGGSGWKSRCYEGKIYERACMFWSVKVDWLQKWGIYRHYSSPFDLDEEAIISSGAQTTNKTPNLQIKGENKPS